MEAILDANDYAEFERKVDILKSKGVDLDHSVQEHDGKFIVLLNKEYDIKELDRLTDE
tara:strand:+ start:504 stop:677 length:174 start_codon:yes stop_codon:yes gene_type:complete